MSLKHRGEKKSKTNAVTPNQSPRNVVDPPEGWKWFHIYYGLLCSSVLIGFAVWFLWIRSPYIANPSFDPLTFLPISTRNQIVFWYRDHPPHDLTTRKSTNEPSQQTNADANSLSALLTFLARYEEQGNFDNPIIRDYDHYMETMINGWISGVFETVKLDTRLLDEIQTEEKGVGSIPGGSRKLNQKIDRAVSPIVSLLYEDRIDQEVNTNSSTKSAWSRLKPEHQIWVYEGLSHCHTTPCRLAKMQLMTLWREKLSLFPEHDQKESWTMLTQLFHPETHPFKLLDAPASVDTLGSLWFRFFATGDITYLHRIFELTRVTGGPAYQAAKDAEIREWTEKKDARREQERIEKWEEEKEQAKKEGKSIPPEPPAIKKTKLPKSPTLELHAHFFNSILYYADEHPQVKRAFAHSLQQYPKDVVNLEFAQAPPFIKTKDGVSTSPNRDL